MRGRAPCVMQHVQQLSAEEGPAGSCYTDKPSVFHVDLALAASAGARRSLNRKTMRFRAYSFGRGISMKRFKACQKGNMAHLSHKAYQRSAHIRVKASQRLQTSKERPTAGSCKSTRLRRLTSVTQFNSVIQQFDKGKAHAFAKDGNPRVN